MFSLVAAVAWNGSQRQRHSSCRHHSSDPHQLYITESYLIVIGLFFLQIHGSSVPLLLFCFRLYLNLCPGCFSRVQFHFRPRWLPRLPLAPALGVHVRRGRPCRWPRSLACRRWRWRELRYCQRGVSKIQRNHIQAQH